MVILNLFQYNMVR